MKEILTHWTKDDLDVLAASTSLEELLKTTIGALKKLPQPVCMVSGPISSGGTGSVVGNIKLFSQAISALNNSGVTTFDQLSLHETMMRLLKNSKDDMELLQNFYLPLFKTGLIKRIYFLPDWQSSKGASWEHEQCKNLDIETLDFPENQLLNM